ncbi:hypothetical protein NUU61_003257 [Penicillium alfredii]|uniref:Branchpoint-bridging protein n=1 Tax=Penicillium alfredii TaxID=1506179 RepID=A0A9W9FT38_9EURO|nr:uncharacterized protein NUU61_003257 [Penicillium alfredii]KAJ5105910.1 hypothetical protein NUU61_003257 [Penicillium alfredii]
MAWRNQGITGSNNIPLGRRRFGGDDPEDSRTATPSSAGADGYKRGRSPVRADPPAPADGIKRRKKRNRWGDQQENKAAGLMGLPTMIMANFTSEQLEAYTLHLRIEEISQKLRINDVVPADGDRSPSPPPQYDNFGRRVNTREYRYRKRLEDERHKLVEKAMKTIPNYHPPSDYRRPTKTQEKVYVPVNDYPEINFIGLLIGPRGNTLKKMETESGAKIAIRGKGSVKEGKGRSDAAHASNQEEDLHCLIMADTEDKVNKAKKLIHNVIETAASIPEGQNELKRNQLRELAALNGTLRDDENQACQNCGQIGHRKYDCPEQRNFTANIICRVCGNAGHMARDCPERQRGSDWRNNPGYGGRDPRAIGTGDAVDREMEQLMNELSGGAPGEHPPRRIEAGPDHGYPDDRDAQPWERRLPPTDAAPWQQRGRENRSRDDYAPRDHGAPPPWAAQSRGGDYGYGGYAAPGTASAPAPWQQQAPPPPPGGQAGYGYGYGYPPPGMGAPGTGPPGMAAPPPPPGMPPYYGGAGSPPPPPPRVMDRRRRLRATSLLLRRLLRKVDAQRPVIVTRPLDLHRYYPMQGPSHGDFSLPSGPNMHTSVSTPRKTSWQSQRLSSLRSGRSSLAPSLHQSVSPADQHGSAHADSQRRALASASARSAQPKWWRVYLFRGMIKDVKRRAPYYWSDWTDAWDYRIVPATVYMYFAKYDNLSVVMIFTYGGGGLDVNIFLLLNLCHLNEVLLAWSLTMHWFLAFTNACNGLTYVTRFSCDIFGFYVACIYLQKGIQVLTRQWGAVGEASAYLSIMVALLVLMSGWICGELGNSNLFQRYIRKFLEDYGTPLTIVFFTGFIHIGHMRDVEVATLPTSKAFFPTVDRPWLVHFWDISVGDIFLAIPFALLLTILFYFDHNVSSLIAQGTEFPLRKPAGFHWDLWLLGLTTFIAGLLGIPFPNGLIPQAPFHTAALCVTRQVADEDDTNKGKAIRVTDHVVEQRVSNFAQGLLTLGTMTGPLLIVLHLIPQGVMAGLFFIMGVQALQGNGITQKMIFLAQDKHFTPGSNPLKRIERRAAIWAFVIIELVGFGATFAITQTIAAIGFPVIILLLIPVRTFLMPRWFTREELAALDGPTASPFTMESVGGTYGLEDESAEAITSGVQDSADAGSAVLRGRASSSEESAVEDNDLERGEAYELPSRSAVRRRSTASRID